MLKKSKISNKLIETDEWRIARLGKFTSSQAHRLVGSIETFNRYVYERVGEELTGKSATPEVDTEATRWGLLNEGDALKRFGQHRGISFLIVQQLVAEPGSRFGSTPDGLIVTRISEDKTEYDVETVEVKCPPTYANYISLFLCNTPEDLKKTEPKYYWQVLDQMDNCEALVGNFVVFHPDFRAGDFKAILIEKTYSVKTKNGKDFPVHNDLKLLRERKAMAETKFNEVLEYMINPM